MPYATLDDVPENVKKLPPHAQRIWRAAFNAAYKTYKGDESKAFATAWAAANKYRSETMHVQFRTILGKFVTAYGEDTGYDKFFEFCENNQLDPSKGYHPNLQMQESFQWLDPMIRLLKADESAKWYGVKIISAGVTMNNTPYPADKLEKAELSMAYRPVNINHDQSRWQPYPRTRTDFVKFDGTALECTLRVDNEDKRLQLQLDHDPSIPDKEWIFYPSLEARPNDPLDPTRGELSGFHFTGLSLLERGFSYPGDPLSEIKSLMLSESVGSAVCRLVEGRVVCDCPPDSGQNGILTISEVKNKIMSEATVNTNPQNADEKVVWHEYQGIAEATWGTGQVNDLPDSSFAYIEPGGKKDESGKTAPRNLRHFPIKNGAGEYDRPHVVAALQAMKGARTGSPPSYVAHVKGPVCAAARSLKIDSEVCGSAGAEGKGSESTVSQEQIDEKMSEIRRLEARVAELELEKGQLEATKNSRISDLTTEVQKTHEELAKVRESQSSAMNESQGFREQMGEVTGKLVKEQMAHKETAGRLKALEESMGRVKVEREAGDQENLRLNEKIGLMKGSLEEMRKERDEARVKEAGASQASLNSMNKSTEAVAEATRLQESVATKAKEVSRITDELFKVKKERNEAINTSESIKTDWRKDRDTWASEKRQLTESKGQVTRRLKQCLRILSESGKIVMEDGKQLTEKDVAE